MTDHPDIVERLRNTAQGISLGADGMGWGPDPSLMHEAAAEITRLRAEAEALRKDYPGDRKLLEAVSRYSHVVLQELQFERGTNSLAAHNLRLTLIEVEKALKGDRTAAMECGVGFPLAAIAATKEQQA